MTKLDLLALTMSSSLSLVGALKAALHFLRFEPGAEESRRIEVSLEFSERLRGADALGLIDSFLKLDHGAETRRASRRHGLSSPKTPSMILQLDMMVVVSTKANRCRYAGP